MATLDWSQCSAVESVPGRLSGAWVFRDTRMPVSAVFENLEAGATIEEIIEQFDITREQINAVLEFAARSLDPIPPPSPLQTPRGCSFFLTMYASRYRPVPSGSHRYKGQRPGMGYADQRRLAGRSGTGRLDVLLTADKNMRYQQNLTRPQNSPGRVEHSAMAACPIAPIAAAVNAATPGSYAEVDIPFR